MVYQYHRINENIYSISVDRKVYGLVLTALTPGHVSEQVDMYLIDENENVIGRVSRPFGFMVKASQEGSDAVMSMLEDLDAQTKNENLNLLETFKEISIDMKPR